MKNGLLALIVVLEETLLYRVKFANIENLQLLYKTHNPLYHCELNSICIKAREVCRKERCWSKSEDVLLKHFIEWHQQKFHPPLPPPKLSFFKKLRKFIWE